MGSFSRARIAAARARDDVAAWADELRRTGTPDAARLALDLALALGHPLDVHQIAFQQNHPLVAMAPDAAYRGTLDDDHRALVDADDGAAATALSDVLAILAEVAGLLWPDTTDGLARAGLAGATRIPATSTAAAVATFPRVAAAVGASASLFQLAAMPSAGDPLDVRVVCGATPVVVLGPRALATDADPGVVRAALARAVALTLPSRVIAAGLAAADGARLIAAVARLFGPPPLRAAIARTVADEEVQRAYDEVVRSALPVRIRTRLEQALATATAPELDLAPHRARGDRAADRVAVLLAPDITTAVALVRQRGGELGHLVRLLCDPRTVAARARLGLGVRPAG